MLPRWARLLAVLLCLCLCLNVVTVKAAPSGLVVRQDEGEPAPEPAPESTSAPEEDEDDQEDDEPEATDEPEETAEPTATSEETEKGTGTTEPTAAPTSPDGRNASDVLNFEIPEGQLPIEPRLTPGFGVAGVLLLISGVVYAVIGIKNAWLHTFFSTAYLCCIATTVLIVYVMSVPVEDRIQGAYVAAIALTGIILGVGATIFKEITEGLGCLFGGFCVSMWLLCLKPGGLLPETAPKVILISLMSLGSFCLYFSHYTRDYALIVLISFGGAMAAVLGIDCFSRAGLKEFWAYVWDLNENLFPLGTVSYPVTKGIRVETAAVIIICLAGIVSQLKLWKVVQEKRAKKAAEKAAGQRDLHKEEEAVGKQVEEANTRERRAWERIYGDGEGDTAVGSGDSGIGDIDSEKRTRHASGISTRPASGEGVAIEMSDMSTPPEAPPKSPKPKGLMVAGKEKEGVVTVRVAHDDNAESPITPSTRDPEERAWIMGKDGDGLSAKRDSKRLSSISKAPAPEIVPLPFQISEEEAERGTIDDRSSVAGTLADDEEAPEKRRSVAKRLSQGSMNLLRSFSQHTNSREMLREHGGESGEDLVIPRRISRASRKDSNASLAVTIDDESVEGAPTVKEEVKGKSLQLKLGDMGHERPFSLETVGTDILNTSDNDPLSPTKPTGDAGAAKPEAAPETPGTPKAPKSTVSATPSARRSLTREALPDALSRTALKYRTNEWVKHSSSADTPAPDDIRVAEYTEEEAPTKVEAPVPVRIDELQQTADAGIAPAAPRSSMALSNSDRLSRSDSRLSVATKLAIPSGAPDHGRDSPSSPVGQVYRSASNVRRSTSGLSTMHQPIYEEDGDMLNPNSSPEEGNSGANSKAPSPVPQDGGLRPPVPGIVSYNSPQTLIGQREMFLRNKSQGNLASGMDYSQAVNAAPSDNGSVYNYIGHAISRPLSPDDDMPLSQRKAIIRQNSVLGSSASLSRPNSSMAPPAESLPFDSHQPSHRKSSVPTPAAREAQLATFRQSVQAELRAGTPVVPSGGRETPFMAFSNSTSNLLPGQMGFGAGGMGMNGTGGMGGVMGPSREGEVQRTIEHQRNILLGQKEAEVQAKEAEKREREMADRAFEQRMRSGGLMDAHREAMRRLQGNAK